MLAGISRFKINKEDALRRIASTDRNMERVRDVNGYLLKSNLALCLKKQKKTKNI